MECLNCGRKLGSDCELTLPWEDGDNAEAYITCSICGYKNEAYGYGEDD